MSSAENSANDFIVAAHARKASVFAARIVFRLLAICDFIAPSIWPRTHQPTNAKIAAATSGQSHKWRRMNPCVRDSTLPMLADFELVGSDFGVGDFVLMGVELRVLHPSRAPLSRLLPEQRLRAPARSGPIHFRAPRPLILAEFALEVGAPHPGERP